MKRANYPPLPQTLGDIFSALMSAGVLQLPREKEAWPQNVDMSRYCYFHRQPGHTVENCFQFRDYVYDLHEQGQIDWSEMAKYIATLKARHPQRQAQ